MIIIIIIYRQTRVASPSVRCCVLHVHLAPLTSVGRRRLSVFCAGYAAAGASTARAVVPVGRPGRRGCGDVGEQQLRRGSDRAVRQCGRSGRVINSQRR